MRNNNIRQVTKPAVMNRIITLTLLLLYRSNLIKSDVLTVDCGVLDDSVDKDGTLSALLNLKGVGLLDSAITSSDIQNIAISDDGKKCTGGCEVHGEKLNFLKFDP